MSRTADVLHDVWVERDKQDIKWGGSTHDDHHTMNEWRDLITNQCARVPLTRKDDRRLLVEVAALAVAAVEALDRKPLWEQPIEAAANSGEGAGDG